MEWACDHGYVVFRHDLDFGSLLFTTNATAPSVLQLRVQHIVPDVVGDAVLETLVTAAEVLGESACCRSGGRMGDRRLAVIGPGIATFCP
jgi:predicted nuclease of predicted toxin-antitoxin system